MSDKPNRDAFHIVAWFLFSKLDPSRCNEIFRFCFPPPDKKADSEFRKQCYEWLRRISDECGNNFPPVFASLFLSPGGPTFIHLMFHFARYVLMHHIKADSSEFPVWVVVIFVEKMESMDSQTELLCTMAVSINVLLCALRALSVLEDEYWHRRSQLRKIFKMHHRRRMLFLQQLEQDNSLLVLGTEFISLPAVFRCYWVRPSSKDWWENLVLKVWNDERWIESFRMSRATLFEIVAELTPALQRNQTAMREPLSVAKRAAIGIWKLANPAFYKNAAEQFGVGRVRDG
ncbi:uncharacterized protein LOC134394230 isoform X2 [Elgaria multicarinata webbii]